MNRYRRPIGVSLPWIILLGVVTGPGLLMLILECLP